jgi:hypothetical protein
VFADGVAVAEDGIIMSEFFGVLLEALFTAPFEQAFKAENWKKTLAWVTGWSVAVILVAWLLIWSIGQ